MYTYFIHIKTYLVAKKTKGYQQKNKADTIKIYVFANGKDYPNLSWKNLL